MLTILVSCQCPTENPTQPAVNQAPIISNQSVSPSETISDAEDIDQVIATDPENSVLTFAIVTNDPNVTFELSSNGILGLGDGQSLDYEVDNNHFLVVSVFDGELSNTATVTVEVRSNQAPILAITNFRIAETIFETNVIGRIVAVPEGAREVFTYQVVHDSSLFEVDSNSGEISLRRGGFLDYERTNRHFLSMSVFDGEFSTTETFSVEVEDVSLANGDAYCGDLTEMAPVIDGSENSFFLSGTGISSNAPYLIPVRSDCSGITFIYDPNYTNGSPDIYFVFTNFTEAIYRYAIIFFEGFIPNVEPTGWLTTATGYPGNNIIASSQGFVSSESAPKTETFNGSSNGVLFSSARIRVFGDLPNRAWLSKKGFGFSRLTND